MFILERNRERYKYIVEIELKLVRFLTTRKIFK